MNHIKSIVIKLVASLVVNLLILGLIFNYSFINVFTLTLILGIVSYILGDLLLYRRSTNTIATASDFALAMLFTWFFLSNITANNNNLFLASVLTAGGLAVFEWFFHKYLESNVFEDNDPILKGSTLKYQTEASEEITPEKRIYKKD